MLSIFFRRAFSISIPISIFFISAEISTIDISYQYIEHHYPSDHVLKLGLNLVLFGNTTTAKNYPRRVFSPTGRTRRTVLEAGGSSTLTGEFPAF